MQSVQLNFPRGIVLNQTGPCPVFTSNFQKIRENSSPEVNFAAFPAAHAPATSYDVVSTSNIPDYEGTACGDVGEAPKRNSEMRGLDRPSALQNYTLLDKNRPFSAENTISADSQLSSGLEPPLTSLKELTTVDDLTMPQQKAEKKQN